jgi:hypothetical protein
MTASQKFVQLIDALLIRSREGKVSWAPGGRDDTFIWSGSSASVAVLTKDNDGQQPWRIQLYDSSGRVIEDETFLMSSPYFEQIGELYGLARADALDINAAIDGLLEDLG